jgi:hypothetical protein
VGMPEVQGAPMTAQPRKDPCDECQHCSVAVVPGTLRQIIARYKTAWDACWRCAVAERGKRERPNGKEARLRAYLCQTIGSDGGARILHGFDLAEAARARNAK